MQEEIFGPILALVPCETFSEAIQFINDRDTPLAAYCFSKGKLPSGLRLRSPLIILYLDKSVKNRFEREVRSGGQTINDVILHLSDSRLPFGGFGASGIGAYNGYHGFQAFSHNKSIYKQLAPEFMMTSFRPPYDDFKIKIIKFLLKKNPRPTWMPNIRVNNIIII